MCLFTCLCEMPVCWPGQAQHLGSIPEHAQEVARPSTLQELIGPYAGDARSDPATPSYIPSGAWEQEAAMQKLIWLPSTEKQNKEALLLPI